MGEVINFDNYKIKKNKNIQKIFEDALSEIKSARESTYDYDPVVFGDLEYMEAYIVNLLIKEKKQGWKIATTEEKFIKAYNYFSDELKDSDPLEKAYFKSELIYFTNIDSSFIDDDYYYINLMVQSLDSNMNNFIVDNYGTIKSIINNLKKGFVKKRFNKDNDYDINLAIMQNLVLDLSDGIDLFTSMKLNTEESIKENESLEVGILTIDRIRNYYVEQEELDFEIKYEAYKRDNESEEMLNKLNAYHKFNSKVLRDIYLIKSYDEEYKEYYLELVRKIITKHNLEKEIDDVVTLTHLYLDNKEILENLTYEALEKFVGVDKIK